MMSGVPPETCSAFNERWNNKFCYKVATCWLFLLIHTTMQGSMNIKFTNHVTLHFVNEIFMELNCGLVDESNRLPGNNGNLVNQAIY
jgi:hypothetical protein